MSKDGLDKRDFYELLHVSRDAPTEVIKASYRTLMQRLKMHPDLGGDSVVAAMINEAHATLTDPDRRAEYDADLPPRDVTRQGLDEDLPLPEPPPPPPRPLDPYRECIFCCMPHDHGRSIFADARCVVCKSPLAIAEQQRFEQNDARSVPRIAKQQEIELFTGWPQTRPLPARSEDISLNGMRIMTTEQLVPNQRVRVRCAQLDAVALVRNASQQARGMNHYWICGLSFVTLVFNQAVGGFVSDRA
ncbi:MAG: J domain-containing protein [Pseudomonadota bacterium]